MNEIIENIWFAGYCFRMKYEAFMLFILIINVLFKKIHNERIDRKYLSKYLRIGLLPNRLMIAAKMRQKYIEYDPDDIVELEETNSSSHFFYVCYI